jgi:hypothetical protein
MQWVEHAADMKKWEKCTRLYSKKFKVREALETYVQTKI